jgi:hypothetical protein
MSTAISWKAHVESNTAHNFVAVFSQKTLYPGGIQTRDCCIWGRCDVHCNKLSGPTSPYVESQKILIPLWDSNPGPLFLMRKRCPLIPWRDSNPGLLFLRQSEGHLATPPGRPHVSFLEAWVMGHCRSLAWCVPGFRDNYPRCLWGDGTVATSWLIITSTISFFPPWRQLSLAGLPDFSWDNLPKRGKI